MKDEAKDRLKNILGAYDEKLAEVERLDTANRTARAAFPERFATLRRETIRPAVQEFADMLNGRGHEVSLSEQEESSTTAGGVRWAAISLRIIPKPFAHRSPQANTSAIEVTFSANRNEGRVIVSSTNTMVNSAGSIGKRGEYEIDNVTADVVAGHVLQTLQEAFAAAR